MRSCHKITELISQSQERPLSLGESMELKLHKMMCSACRNFDKNVKSMSQGMKAFTQRQDKPDEVSKD